MDATKPLLLIVDDNAENLRLLGTLLRQDYRIKVARTGDQAVEMACKEPPSLVLMDVNMPGMDGFEACRRIRADEGGSRVPVIFLTGKRRDQEDIEEGFAAGGVDYVTKPFHISELISRVRTHVELSEQRRRLLDAKEFAERTAELKTKFVSLLAHDLRSPLGNLQMMVEMLSELSGVDLKGTPVDEQTQLLGMIDRVTRRLFALSEDILNMSRVELGTLVPRIEAVAAAPLVKEQFESLAMQAERKKVILENQVPEGLEVMADPLLLAEVLHNLLSNALKFSHEGQRVVVLAEGEGSLGPVLVVMDEGIGMPGQVLKGLFDQGTSVSRPGTMDEVGTGFGLPFCFEIMEAHGGRIWATSEEGKGSRFFVELPREPAK